MPAGCRSIRVSERRASSRSPARARGNSRVSISAVNVNHRRALNYRSNCDAVLRRTYHRARVHAVKETRAADSLLRWTRRADMTANRVLIDAN